MLCNKKEGTINYTTLGCAIKDLDRINPDLTKDIRKAFKKLLILFKMNLINFNNYKKEYEKYRVRI